MPVESSVELVKDLNPSWPLGTDNVAQGAEHIRKIKQVLIDQFGHWSIMRQDHLFFYNFQQVYRYHRHEAETYTHDRVHLGRNSINYVINLYWGAETQRYFSASNSDKFSITVENSIACAGNVTAYYLNTVDGTSSKEVTIEGFVTGDTPIGSFVQEGDMSMKEFLEEYFETIDKILKYRNELNTLIVNLEQVLGE